MSLDYASLNALRSHHPAWRLLRSDHAPLVAGFLHRVFITPNLRVIAAADLIEALEDELYVLRDQFAENLFPKPAQEYLNEWAHPDKGWLRKFYRQDSDEVQFDLTPAAEKAIVWLDSLTERHFVGTESRLLTLFALLKQISEYSEADPQKRIAELQQKRQEIDREIARVQAGDVPVLDDTALKDRFQQFTQIARELLSDFREVEHNFRLLDRRVRERIALWEGGKGALLAEIMGEHDAIGDSDQGRSFRAFWDFLLSGRRQEELSGLLEQVLGLPAVRELQPDARLRRIHYDWLEAGEHTQRTVAQLSQQLRRFLDDKAWLENRRIMDILRGIETKALALRDTPPGGELMTVADTVPQFDLPLERPLYSPAIKPQISDIRIENGEDSLDASALYAQIYIDKAQLAKHVRQSLQNRTQISLKELIERAPLQQGLAELISYLQLGGESFNTLVVEDSREQIVWTLVDADRQIHHKRVTMPRVIFLRKA
ncbi:DUF3375 domain-containing protein [Methylomonas paludis]|uniref:DUF3375 domain-containing protein n=1 Tax=Methylomonas paludis TaxID=1173101 RepID=A0A975MP88_9GAMM|nr:DUF3375 domain-containing protein [Methylomonas paludis]QWF70959.1 DUF3375 domain-containing protein [Methylomonas paludis]